MNELLAGKWQDVMKMLHRESNNKPDNPLLGNEPFLNNQNFQNDIHSLQKKTEK